MTEERRRSKRTSLSAELDLKRVDGRDGKEVSASVVDISKTGLGFTSINTLRIGELYEFFLSIWTKEVIHAFLQVVRVELKGDGFFYGAAFIGMSETDSARIEAYQAIHDTE